MKARNTKYVGICQKETKILAIIFQIMLCHIFVTNGSITVTPENESRNMSKYSSLTDREYNTILHQFEEIIVDLEALKVIFSSPSTEYKSQILSALSQRSKCTISKDKLTSFKIEMEGVLANVSRSNNQSTCMLNLNDSDNCYELTKIIQCVIQNLKNGFQDAVRSKNGYTIHEIAKWHTAYESLLDKYEKHSDSLKQSVSQDNQVKFVKLQTDLKNIGKSLNTVLDSLESTTINLCVLEIKNGQAEAAVEHSKGLKSISISQIIKKTYCVGNDTDCEQITKNIFTFIKDQSNIENIVIACETYYNEMESKNDFIPEKVFALGYTIDTSPAKDRLQDVFKKIEPTYNVFAEKIAEVLAKVIAEAMSCAFGLCPENSSFKKEKHET